MKNHFISTTQDTLNQLGDTGGVYGQNLNKCEVLHDEIQWEISLTLIKQILG